MLSIFICTCLLLCYRFIFLTDRTSKSTITCWISWKMLCYFLTYSILLCTCLSHVISSGKLITKAKSYHFVPLTAFHNNNWCFKWSHFYARVLTDRPKTFSLTFVPVCLQSTIFKFFTRFLLSLLCISMFSNKPFKFDHINTPFYFKLFARYLMKLHPSVTWCKISWPVVSLIVTATSWTLRIFPTIQSTLLSRFSYKTHI